MSTTTAPDLTSLAVSGTGTVISLQTSKAAGTVTTSGTAVTGVTGTPFVTGTSWVGLPITINAVQYLIASVTSATALVLTTSAGTQASPVAFSGPVIYTRVAELKSVDFSGSKNDLEDVTNFDSAGRFKQYIATLADAGDCSINGNYIASDVGQSAFRGAFSSAAVLSYEIVLPLQAGQTVVGETWVFLGILSELDNHVQYDKVLGFSAKVKVTGPITVILGS
jgi:predicted secreted protein